MQHKNVSTHSLNENLYDIALSGSDSTRAVGNSRLMPRRVGSMSCLKELSEHKRPSEYYLTRMGQVSAPAPDSKALPPMPPVAPQRSRSTHNSLGRPGSDCSVSSAETSKDSDDAVSMVSTPFDAVDSRLSSITNYSTYSSPKAGESTLSVSEIATKHPVSSIPEQDSSVEDSIIEESTFESESLDQVQSSLSTITLKNSSKTFNNFVPRPHLPVAQGGPLIPPKLRSESTSSVLQVKKQPSSHKQLPPLSRQNTASSSFMLTRTKTRYLNPKETKERKELRKKLYEENDDDDELLTNDLDLVFNVPVMKNHGEIYRTRRTESTPNMLLSRNDIVTSDDSKYPNKSSDSMKPCPLPGKLSRSNLSLDRVPMSIPESRSIQMNEDIPESDESPHTSFASIENDSAISHNISEFYTQRSLSYSALARASRDQQLTDKMPNYVKTHSSVEDISLISPEKLEVVDQSRPINLPPKKLTDKAKHHRELHKLITDFEASTKSASNIRKNLGLSAIANQQSWTKFMLSSENKDFHRKINHDREKLRKLNWESVVPSKFRFDYYMKVLLLSAEDGFSNAVEENFVRSETMASGLSQQLKAVKEAEFKRLIEQVLQRPLFRNFISQVSRKDPSAFDMHTFQTNFTRLLYFKSFSKEGLQKHHRVFVIPVFLMMFQNTESLLEICKLIELFDLEVFNERVFSSLNKKLSCWSDLSCLSQSSAIYKLLKRFNCLEEFQQLNSTTLFEMIIQLNDRLPLSLSAPSTPIIVQSPSRASSKSSSESENGTATGSNSSLDDISDGDSLYSESSSLSLVGVFLQLLVIHSRSKNSEQKTVNLFQSCLLTMFQFYHINWNSHAELVKNNKSIKLNNSSDQSINLESFLDKWKDIFKKL